MAEDSSVLLSLLLPSDDILRYSGLEKTLEAKTLKEIKKEPAAMQSNNKRIEKELETLALENYGCFLETSSCIASTRAQLSQTKVHANSLLSDIPSLNDAFMSFSSEAQQISATRTISGTLLSHYPQLLELLEIPQLMQTCVRNKYYEQALQLQVFVNKLAKSHPSLSIIQSIAKDVGDTTIIMKHQLMARLRGECDVSTCIRVVGYLQRLDVKHLHVVFLQQRDVWLQSLIDALPLIATAPYLLKVSECYRTALFEIVTQYNTVLPEDPSRASSTDNSASAILASYALQRLSRILAFFDQHLAQLPLGEDFSAVVDSIMYLSVVLSRVGLDFRLVIHKTVEDCLCQAFSKVLQPAAHYFSEALKTHRWVLAPKLLAYDDDDNDDDDGQGGTAGEGRQSSVSSPPARLLQHEPLAAFTNDVLSALNQLRHFAAFRVKSLMRQQLHATLVQATTALRACGSSVAFQEQHASRRAVYDEMCRAMAEDCVPHLGSCFEAVFGSTELFPGLSQIMSGLYVREETESDVLLEKLLQ